MASRSEARERKTTESPNFKSSRSDTATVLLRKRHFTRANALHFPCAASFTRSKIVFHRAATLGRRPNFAAQHWPCLVPGCRLVPSKIAASGIENALLAMTESVGFSEKRDSFQIEMFEKRCGATPRKKTAHNKNRPFSKQNRPNFVSLRGLCKNGTLILVETACIQPKTFVFK